VRYGSTGLIRGEPSVRIVPSNATRVTSNRWLARCAIRGAAVSSSCQVLIGASLLTHAQRILPNVPARVAFANAGPDQGVLPYRSVLLRPFGTQPSGEIPERWPRRGQVTSKRRVTVEPELVNLDENTPPVRPRPAPSPAEPVLG
jgi:hypothetical protein